MKNKIFTIISIFVIATGMFAQQQGELDPTFNQLVGAGANNVVKTIKVQTDGKIIFAGEFIHYGNSAKKYITRLLSDGTIDNTFNIGIGSNAGISALNILSDGKILIIGSFTTFNGVSANRIARLNSDGTLDTSFISGSGFNFYSSIAVQTDGKIILAGFFPTYNGIASSNIVRLNTNGTIDTTFNVGTGASSTIKDLAIQADGKIIIVGDFNTYNGTGRLGVARINPDGSLDSGFDPGAGANSTVETVKIMTDSSILIGGIFTTYNFANAKSLVKINSNGTVNTSFNTSIGANSTIGSISLLSNGKILIGGDFTSFNGASVSKIARLNADATVDLTFNTVSGAGGNETIHCIQEQNDGKILIGGDFTFYNGVFRERFTRLNTNGLTDTNFFTPIGYKLGADSAFGILCIANEQNGKFLIGGQFLNYNGVPRNKIARINSDGNIDTSFNPGNGANFTVRKIVVQTDGKILVGGNFTTFNGISHRRIVRLNTDGSLDTTFSPGTAANDVIYDIKLQTDGKILLCGLFTIFKGISKNRLVRLNTDGTIDSSFDIGAGVNDQLSCISLQNDGKILINGSFTSYNGILRNHLARLNVDGTLDGTFNAGGTGFNYYFQPEYSSVQTDGKIMVAGQFTSYNGTAIKSLLRLNENGTLDTTFTPAAMTFINGGTNPNGIINCIAIQSDGKILIGGSISTYGGIPTNGLVRLDNNGLLDTIYNPTPTNPNLVTIEDIKIDSDGKILAGGGFTEFNGIIVGNITRLLSGNTTLEIATKNINDATIYPNPSTGIFNLQTENPIINANITVADLNGRIMYETKSENLDNKTLDLSNLQNGIYLLNISNGDFNHSKKIIKQ